MSRDYTREVLALGLSGGEKVPMAVEPTGPVTVYISNPMGLTEGTGECETLGTGIVLPELLQGSWIAEDDITVSGLSVSVAVV